MHKPIQDGVEITTHKFKQIVASFNPIIGGRKVYHPKALDKNGNLVVLYFPKAVSRDYGRHAYMNYVRETLSQSIKTGISAKVVKKIKKALI